MNQALHWTNPYPQSLPVTGNHDPNARLGSFSPFPVDFGLFESSTLAKRLHNSPFAREIENGVPPVPPASMPMRDASYYPFVGSPRGPFVHFQGQRSSQLEDSRGEASRPLKRRKGGKIYSGCATCHQRKIKCDQRRPTCHNCEKSRQYICDGYSHDHFQADRDTVYSAQAQTRKRTPDPPEPRTLRNSSSPEEHHLATKVGIQYSKDGFFSGDHAQHQRQPLSWLDGVPSLDSETDLAFPPYLQSECADGALDMPSPPGHIFDVPSWHHAEQSPNTAEDAGEPCHAPAEVETADSERLLSPKQSRHDSTIFRRERWNNPISIATSPPLIEFQRFPLSIRQLLFHYRTHVSQLMMPTVAPSQNPWLQIYLPIALQEPQTTAKHALLNSILAVSAFNQAGLRKSERQSYREMASSYSHKAAQLLKINDFNGLEAGELRHDTANRQALLATALTMTTIEVFSGASQGVCHKHLRTAKEIVENTGGTKWWLSDPANTTLLQIFRCYRIVAETSGWTDAGQHNGKSHPEAHESRHIEATMMHTRDDELMVSSTSQSCEYSLDVSFGVSMKTLWCLNKIVDLAAIKLSTPAGERWWETHTDSLFKLESELFAVLEDPQAFSEDPSLFALGQQSDEFTPSSSSRCSTILTTTNTFLSLTGGIPQIIAEEIRENHLWAFHYSVALFYRRAICGGGENASSPITAVDSTVPQPTGQYLVSKVLEHLENIDALKVDTPIANTLWPAFIAAVEAVDADLRHRVLVWFARAKRHGIGNIATAKTLVLEIWRRVDRQTHLSYERKPLHSELGPVDWRDIMREMGMYIMLT